MKKSLAPALLLCSALALCSCGADKTDRALSGAGVGAVVGGLVGSAVGDTGTGILVGASVGATTGALTEMDTINLGKPWWK